MAEKRRNIDMTEGPIAPRLMAFAIPLFMTGVLQILYNAADTMVVGRFAGHTSMAAIGATTSLNHLIVNVFIGLSMGVNVVAAHHYGAKDSAKVGRIVHTAVSLALIGGVFLSFLGYFLSPVMLRLMDTPEDVIDKSILYMRVLFLAQPVNLLYNFGSAILRAYGETRKPLFYLLFAGAVNVVANLIFVIVFHMDVAGVAIATAMSQAISAVLVLRYLMTSDDMIRLDLRRLGFHGRELKEIARIGIPAGLQSSLFSISNVVIQSSLNAFGSLVVAGNTAALNVESFMNMAHQTMGQTNLSAVSQNYGAGNRERVRKVMRTSVVLSVLIGIALGIIAILGGRFFLSFFSTEREVIEYGMTRVLILASGYFIFNYQEIMVSTSRGLGNSFNPMIVSVMCICVFRLFWVFTVFRLFPTLLVLYLSFPVSWFLAAVFQYILLRSYARKLKLF